MNITYKDGSESRSPPTTESHQKSIIFLFPAPSQLCNWLNELANFPFKRPGNLSQYTFQINLFYFPPHSPLALILNNPPVGNPVDMHSELNIHSGDLQLSAGKQERATKEGKDVIMRSLLVHVIGLTAASCPSEGCCWAEHYVTN